MLQPAGQLPQAQPGADGRSPMSDEAAQTLRQTELWMGIAAASMLCGVSCFFGLIGLLACHTAREAASRGQVADAQAKLKLAKWMTISGFATFVLVVVGYALRS